METACFKDLLEAVGIVAVGHACADDHAGMVVDDDDKIDLMGFLSAASLM